MKIKELYNQFPNVLILHAISKNGKEVEIPAGTQFLEQIKYSIKISQRIKLSTFSFAFNKNYLSNHSAGPLGVIIKDAEIEKTFKEDCGLRADNYEFLKDTFIDDSYNDTIFAHRDGTNEIIVKKCRNSGHLYFSKRPHDVTWEEIHNASGGALKVPVFFLKDSGLYETYCDQKFKIK